MDVQTEARAQAEFAKLFATHSAGVWRALRRLGVREADVEDVCQEVFLVVHRRRDDFEGRSSLSTWLYGITVRVASDYRRRAHIRREVVQAEVPDQASPPTQADELDLRRARGLLDAILDELDDDKRAVFVLFEIEEMPMKDVADAVGCPLQTAYSRLYAARSQVQARSAVLGRAS